MNCPVYLAAMQAAEQAERFDPMPKSSQLTLNQKRTQVEHEAARAGAISGAKAFVVSSTAVGLLNKFHAGFRGWLSVHRSSM